MATERRGRRGGVKLPGLQEIRLERGYTVRGLAEAAGVNPATVTAIENGHRGAQGSTLRALAETLGVETSELVGRGVLSRGEARTADPAERALAYAARDVAEREGRDPREVFSKMRDEALTLEEILGGALSLDEALARARGADAASAGGSGGGPRLGAGEGVSDEIVAQRDERYY